MELTLPYYGQAAAIIYFNLLEILEMESIFAKFHEPSRGLMRYAEKLMTYGKADSNHSNNVSFGNCMGRIPWSYNAKYIQFDDNGQIVNIPPKSEVKIAQPAKKERSHSHQSADNQTSSNQPSGTEIRHSLSFTKNHAGSSAKKERSY